LTLLDPVSRHLREFAGRKETIRDLLTHTSGMPEFGPAPLKDLYLRYDWKLSDVVLLESQQPPLFAPGERWQYSNTGMAALGRVVEVAGGMPFEKFIETRILRPLEMNDTHTFLPEAKYPRLAMLYVPGKGGKLQAAGPGIYRKGGVYSMPEGGLYSTAEDYAKFLECLRQGGAPLISKPMFEVMIANHMGSAKGPPAAWGLGFQIDPATGGFGHGGAFGTQGWAETKTGVTRVFMVQRFGGSIDEIRKTFTDIVAAALR
jgi:CubicO group peptidase (beta-lactamase class C family)